MEVQNRDYQQRILQKTITHYENNIPSVGIVSPTGSGKTIMGMQFLKYVEDNYPDLTFNWVAMRRQLLRQAANTNRNMFGMKNINFVSMFEKNPPKADIIVIDELQHSCTESFNNVSSWDLRFMLGLSATPFRTDKLKLPFNKMVQDAGIHRLIQEKWLCQYWHYCMEEYNPRSVARTYMDNIDEWGKTVVFFSTINECMEFQDLLAQKHIRCEVVSGSTTNAYREDQLDAFDNDEYNIVANVAILNEGFDCPALKTVFVRDSSRLPAIQMAGRGFRIHEGKDHCNIIQSKMSKWQFTKHAKPQRAFVEKDKKFYALGSNSHINNACKDMIKRLTQIEVAMPAFIAKNKSKRIMAGE